MQLFNDKLVGLQGILFSEWQSRNGWQISAFFAPVFLRQLLQAWWGSFRHVNPIRSLQSKGLVVSWRAFSFGREMLPSQLIRVISLTFLQPNLPMFRGRRPIIWSEPET